ncbi:MAG: hypothetical protein ABW189_03390 [Rickettsiales bacterium]
MKRTFLPALATSAALLSACVPPASLTQQWKAAPPAERHALLMKACMREAAISGGSSRKPQFYAHARRMGEICSLFDAQHKEGQTQSCATSRSNVGLKRASETCTRHASADRQCEGKKDKGDTPSHRGKIPTSSSKK